MRLTSRSLFSYWRLTWRRLTAVFGPPLLVLTVGLIAHGGTSRIVATRDEDQRSREATDAASEMVSRLADAETGQRGFLLTNNEDYLLPYARAVDSLPLTIARLRKAIAASGSTTGGSGS